MFKNRILAILACSTFAAVAQVAPPPSHPLFEGDVVHEIWLTFSQPDYWEQLTRNFAENEDDVPYIEASFTWNDVKFDTVGVRFKGNSSYRGANTRKKPFRIKLNEFVKGQKIQGIASFNLNNSWSDASHVREKVHFEMAAASGMRVPRMNYAALYVNGEYLGLYFLGEVINGDFLSTRYEKDDRSGNLYKSELPGTLRYLGEDPAAYKREFEKQSNETEDDWSDLIALTDALREPTETLPARIEPMLDVDSVLRALAIDNLLANLDSYAGMGQNYYLYKRPLDRKFEFLSWDPSLSFGAMTFGFQGGDVTTVPLTWVTGAQQGPGGGGPGGPGGNGQSAERPLAKKLWEVPAYKQRYMEIYRELVANIAIPQNTVARIIELQTMIRPWLEKDTQKLSTMDAFEQSLTRPLQQTGPGQGPGAGPGGQGGQGGGNAPGLEPFLKGRLANVATQLSNQ